MWKQREKNDYLTHKYDTNTRNTQMTTIQDPTTSNATFRFTDQDVTPFVVKPYTANGPASPSTTSLYSNPNGVSAVSANTSLVFIGRGVPFYGEVVLSNLTYLLENFANKSRPNFPIPGQLWYKKVDYTDPVFPSDPIAKGMYVWNGLSWDVVLTKGSLTPQLDLNNNRILNVGNAVDPKDAVNLQTGDSRYVKISGGNIAGLFNLTQGDIFASAGTTISMVDLPTDDKHVANKAYVSLVSNSIMNSVNAVSSRVDTLSGVTGSYIGPSGGTLTGNLTFSNTSRFILQSGGPDPLFGGRHLSQIAVTPVSDDEAASKKYVDDTAVTLNATISTTNGTIATLSTNLSTNYARLDGAVMTGGLSMSSTSNLALVAGGTATFGTRRLQNVGTPTATTDAATKAYVDNSISNLSTSKRYVVKQTGSLTTAITLPDWMAYKVNQNKLLVYSNGLKYVSDVRSAVHVYVTGTNLTSASDTGLPAATPYSVDVTLGGGAPVTLTITTGSGVTTFSALISLLNTAAQLASLAVTFGLDVFSTTSLRITCEANASGTGHAVTLTSGLGSTFACITGVVIPFTTISGVTYDYVEVGNPNVVSTQVTLAVIPATNDILEFVLTR